MTRSACAVVVATVLAVAATGCGARVDSFDPVTTQGAAITSLFWVELAISAVLFVLIVGVIVYSLTRFRGRTGEPDPPQNHGNRRLEILWTVTPAAILFVIFVLVIQTMTEVNAAEPGSQTIRVIGHQWWWELQYPDQHVVTANELHVAVNTPYVLHMESGDVIHSFSVPQIGWMRDAIPTKVNYMSVRATQVGTLEGGCNQYCGAQHAWMRERVVVQPRDQFDAWVAQQQQPAAPTGSRGEQVFLQNTCVSCHAIAGTSAAAQVGPNLTHLGSRGIIGAGVLDNTPDNLRRWLRNAQAVKPGVLMPGYPNLSDADIAALADYLEGLK